MGDLAALGLTQLEEDVYMALVEHPVSTPAVLAPLLGAGRARVAGALESLAGRGLATASATTPRRYLPEVPSDAVDLLVLEQQRALEAARIRSRQLDERLHVSMRHVRSDLEVVEVVTGRAECSERLRQIHLAARTERLVFTRPPFIEDPGASADESVSMVARGVTVRSIYDPDGLEDGRIVAHARDCIRGGEVCRVGSAPVKLDVVDRSVAVLPVSGGDEPVYQVLVVRARPVVQALLALFERYWELAAPLRLGDGGWPGPVAGDPGLSVEEREVLSLLSAGQKDDSIARSLGLADRTVGRRIARLMSLAGAKTRFQLAEAAMRRGWMD